MSFANWAKNRPDLELDTDRVVVRRAGRRISTRGGPGHGLTWGGAATGFTVQLRGFRPDLPYTVTAAVVAMGTHPPIGWRRALRFQWRFPSAVG